jgi:hypothetical protein
MKQRDAPVGHAPIAPTFLPLGPLLLHRHAFLMVACVADPRLVSLSSHQRAKPTIYNNYQPDLASARCVWGQTFSRLEHEFRLASPTEAAPLAPSNELVLTEIFLIGLGDTGWAFHTWWQPLCVDARPTEFAEYGRISQPEVRAQWQVDSLQSVRHVLDLEDWLVHATRTACRLDVVHGRRSLHQGNLGDQQ